MEWASKLEPTEHRPARSARSTGLPEVVSIYESSMHKMWTLLDGFQKLGVTRHRCSTLCCDIENFTALTESADPDDLLAVFTDLMDMCMRAIDATGGIVYKFIGDWTWS
eukprot:m51a1_g11562 hypothetical protein (109) ;mRNA; r:233-693